MSDISTTNKLASDAPTAGGGTAVATPEFDRQEINSFGKDDGHAIAVIGKMLVLFFFYSLLVMAAVAGWTLWGFGQADSTGAESHHQDGSTADF